MLKTIALHYTRRCCMIASLLLLANLAATQSNPLCNDLNYLVQPRFTEVSVSTIPFAYPTNLNGNQDTLRMDIYQPLSDTSTERPVIIWLHGGRILQHQREDMAVLCRLFAKRGYVCATIDYRQRPPLSRSEDTMRLSFIHGMHDLKSAIRHLRLHRRAYRLSETNLLVGGRSEGAIVAMTTAMLDSTDSISNSYRRIIAQAGGFEGASDTLGISASVRGVFNLSGGIPERVWIDRDDPNLVSVFVAKDSSVPHQSGLFATVTRIDGALGINDYLSQVGKTSTISMIFNEFPNVVYSEPYLTFVFGSPLWTLSNFGRRQLCPLGSIQVGIDPSFEATNSMQNNTLSAYPNPSRDQVTISLPITEGSNTGLDVEVYNMYGSLVHVATNLKSDKYMLYRNDIEAGMYIIRVKLRGFQGLPDMMWSCRIVFL